MDSLLDYIIKEVALGPWSTTLLCLKYFVFPFFLVLLVFYLKWWWLYWRQSKYAETLEYVLLATDIPKENIQSPKAVENMFDQISGAHSAFNFVDKWWYGKFQARFSFEIISIDGYVQFLVYTQKNFRDLVEASIYAQYPDAEITEVEDYAQTAPREFPNEQYDLWGAEFLMINNWVYPVQTYPFFEHPLSKDIKDPMIALTEAMASIKKGENVWIQWIVTMTGFEWRKKCQREIDRIVGKDMPSSSWREDINKWLGGWFNDFVSQIVGIFSEEKTKQEKEKLGLLNLSPDEVNKIKAIEAKMGKTGFLVKMRMIYFAPRDIFAPSRCVSSTAGAIKQFAGPYNGFKPEGKITRTKNFILFNTKRLASRQRRILNAYQKRSDSLGVRDGFILNAEEMATVWHFPVMVDFKPSPAKRVESKKASPPSNLPTNNSSDAPSLRVAIRKDE